MKTFLTTLYSFLVLSLTAQSVTISEPVSLRNDQAYEIIGKMKDRVLLFRDRANNDFEIQAFDRDLQLSWKKELEFEEIVQINLFCPIGPIAHTSIPSPSYLVSLTISFHSLQPSTLLLLF